MKKVMVEVLDNNGSVLTTLSSGAAVEAVKNIAVKAKMRVFTAHGEIVVIDANRNRISHDICVKVIHDDNLVGYMEPETFTKIHM